MTSTSGDIIMNKIIAKEDRDMNYQQFKVLVIGTISWDSIIDIDDFPQKSGTYFASAHRDILGGTASGKSLNLHRLGFDVTLLTKLANDDAGRKIQNVLKKEGICYHYIEDEVSTERHTNLMNKQGERISIYTDYGKFGQTFDSTAYEKYIEEADIILLDICEFVKRLFPILEKHKHKIWVDIHDYDGRNSWHKEFLPFATNVFMSSDVLETEEKVQAVVENLLQDKQFVVCTHGKKGAEYFSSGGERVFQEIVEQFLPIDSNGAGDAFVAGYLYGVKNGHPVDVCMKYATLVSGFTIASPLLYNEELSVDSLEKMYQCYFK